MEGNTPIYGFRLRVGCESHPRRAVSKANKRDPLVRDEMRLISIFTIQGYGNQQNGTLR